MQTQGLVRGALKGKVRQMDLQDSQGTDRWIEETQCFADGYRLCEENASVNVHVGHVQGHCPQ